MVRSSRGRPGANSVDDAEDVLLGHDQVVDVVDLDLGAGVVGEDHRVALLHAEGQVLAGLLVEVAVADRDDLALLGLVLGGLGQVDAALGAGGGLVALDEDLVAEGSNLHEGFSDSCLSAGRPCAAGQ